jgi:hypothetical protein
LGTVLPEENQITELCCRKMEKDPFENPKIKELDMFDLIVSFEVSFLNPLLMFREIYLMPPGLHATGSLFL